MARPLSRGGLYVLLFLFVLPASAGAGLSARDELKAGFTALRLGDTKTGLAHLNRAIKSKRLSRQDRVLAYSFRGDAYRYLKELRKALRDYNIAIKIAKKSSPREQRARLYENRGLIYQRKGQYDKAIKDYNQALRYNSASAMAYYRRGTAYRLKRNFDQAVSDYSMALAYHKHHRYYYSRSQAFARLGQLDKAVKDMKTAVRLNPKSRQYKSRLSYLKSLHDR